MFRIENALLAFWWGSFESGRSVLRWRSVKGWIFLIYSVLALRSILVFSDKVSAPSNASSCTRNYARTDGAIFNPYGFFDGDLLYNPNYIGKFCVMYQRWAWPSKENYVRGFAQSPIPVTGGAFGQPVHNCDNIQDANTVFSRIVGFADRGYCLPQKPYSSLSMGISTPVNQFTQNAFYYPCPANKGGESFCFDSNGNPYTGDTPCEPGNIGIGAPVTICSTCLSYYRQQTGDVTGPKGYEHCETSDTTGINFFCPLCPVIDGSSSIWDSPEDISDTSLGVVMGFCIAIPIFYVIEGITFLVLSGRAVREATGEGKEKKSKRNT